MSFYKIKSFAKINLALNVIGKNSRLHKIETVVAQISLHDEILIKRIKSRKHNISFSGEFGKKIPKHNTVSKLLNILEEKNLLKNKKFDIKIKKKVPLKSGLGGGSMNAANILKFFFEKRLININHQELTTISNLIGSDVILGLSSPYLVLNSSCKVKSFFNCKKIHTLIVKPNFGCSTKKIYSKVRKYSKAKFKNPSKIVFDLSYLEKASNDLEAVAISIYPKIKLIKKFLENLPKTVFVRMTGSGSALVAYFKTKENCDKAKKQFKKKYKNYWCIASKTI